MDNEATQTNPKFIVKKHREGLHISGTNTASFGHKTKSADGLEEGVWAEWNWNNGHFQLTNDRYGFYPLFYYAQNGNFGVSSNIIDLIQSGASTEIDDRALAVFLRLGFFIGDDTPFKYIRTVPPNCNLSWRDRHLDIGTNACRIAHTTSVTSRKHAIKIYGELFQTAINRMLPTKTDKTALPLSGGRDSRHILFALSKAGKLPNTCLTMRCHPPRNNEDVHIATLVANELGVRHVIIEPPHSILSAKIRNNALASFCVDENEWLIPLGDYIKEQDYSLVYDGIGGDVLSCGAFLDQRRIELYDSGQLDLLAEELLGSSHFGKREHNLRKVLPDDIYRRWSYELATDHLTAELSKYTQARNPIGQFFFWNRTRREIAFIPWGILAGSTRVFAPYLAHDVFDFLTQIPVDYLLDGTFHTNTIAAFYPEYAHLPYENKESPPMAKIRRTDVLRFLKETCGFVISERNNISYIRRSFLGRLLPCLCIAITGSKLAAKIPQHFSLPIYLVQLHSTGDNGMER